MDESPLSRDKNEDEKMMTQTSENNFFSTKNGPGESSIQVCDDVCYEMYRFQVALKQRR